MKKIKLILLLINIILIILTLFFELLIPAKISLIIMLIIFAVLTNINIEKIKIIQKFIIIALIVIIPIMFKISFDAYKINQNPILFEKEYNNVICTFNNVESTFYINGTGKSPSYESLSSVEWNKYKKGIKTLKIGDEIITIGSNLFSNCNALVNVYAPDTITIIGNKTFFNCNKLSSFNTNKAYTIIIPKETSIIGESAFEKCIRIQKLYLYKNIKEIYNNAFNCENLKEIYYEGTEEEWNEINFGNNVFPEDTEIYYNFNINNL